MRALNQRIEECSALIQRRAANAPVTEAEVEEARRTSEALRQESDLLVGESLSLLARQLGILAMLIIRLRRWFALSFYPNVLADDPPGMRLSRLLRHIYGSRYAERVFDPIIADLQHELAEAREDGEGLVALTAIRIRGYYAVLKATGALWVLSLFYRVIRAFKT